MIWGKLKKTQKHTIMRKQNQATNQRNKTKQKRQTKHQATQLCKTKKIHSQQKKNMHYLQLQISISPQYCHYLIFLEDKFNSVYDHSVYMILLLYVTLLPLHYKGYTFPARYKFFFFFFFIVDYLKESYSLNYDQPPLEQTYCFQ